MIVAIGVAFFAGIKASIPDMQYTADQYFDDYNLQDIQVVSTMGLTKDDVEAINKIENIEGIFATNTVEALVQDGTSSLVLKVHGMPLEKQSENPNYINQARLIEGRLPEKSGECVIEHAKMFSNNLQIGDKITLQSGTKDAIKDTLKNDTYTIVGTVYNPNYLSYEKGTASIGKGEIDYYIMIPQEDFIVDYYTEVLLTVKNAKQYNSYQEDYFTITDPVKNALETLGVDQAAIRYETIRLEAQNKIDEGYQQYEDGKKAYEDGIKEAESKLNTAQIELIVGETTIKSQEEQLNGLLAAFESELASAKEQLEQANQVYEENLAKIEALRPEVEKRMEELEEELAGLEEETASIQKEIDACEEQLKDPNLSESERKLIEEKKRVLEANKRMNETLITYRESLIDACYEQIRIAEEILNASKQQINDIQTKIDEKTSELETTIQEKKQQLADAKVQLEEGRKQYEAGVIELEKNKIIGKEELEIAKEKLDKAQYELDNVEQPQWYVLDRNMHYSYRDYESVTQRMDGIAAVFPVFFLLVAALVCLTTMTRMVDEQRGVIGTLKALGYGKFDIAMKYIMYAAIASIGGSIFGCLVGMRLFPYVIFNAWNIMYTLPELSYELQLGLALKASAAVSSVTILAAVFACYKELIETPALLMRPKAPKVGKKIILEKIPFIWNRFNFTLKVTARNLFRYKKRFFMTVIGISGCTALLVAGFGIRNSVSDVVGLQYGEIQKYDMQISFSKDLALSDSEKEKEFILKQANVEEAMAITSMNLTSTLNHEDSTINLVVPNDVQRFEDFVTLRTRNKKEEVKLENDGAVISEKLAKNYGISIGDSFTFKDPDGIEREVVINGICENYVGHVMYMTPVYYKEIFHIRQLDTGMIAKLKDTSDLAQEQLGNEVLKHDNITSVSFFNGIAETFDETINSLNIVIVVLISAAGMLAFVVLYNLTNVNISERIREIATIKVLGFYDKEVSSYVYRENVILTIIGAFCGLLLGIWLHGMIMNLAEMENIMFGRNIYFISYVYSFLITLVFAAIVNAFMYRKLKNVPMVESLKSVE